MRTALKILAVLVVGTALGLAATWITVWRGAVSGAVADGPWRTNLAAGSPQSDPYTRAFVAVHGLLALGRGETIYYTAEYDDAGDRLDGKCLYVVAGRNPDARWWSITAYGPDDYLIPNPANRYSMSDSTVLRKKDGSFEIDVGGTEGGANWIPAGTAGFSLTLRLYNPGPVAAIDPEHTPLPSIRKVSCL